jgi:hypothetical protein
MEVHDHRTVDGLYRRLLVFGRQRGAEPVERAKRRGRL